MRLRHKTLVRFVVLRLDHLWSHWVPAEVREPKSPVIRQLPKTQVHTRRKSRRVP